MLNVIGDVGAAVNNAKTSKKAKVEEEAEEITLPAQIDSKCNNTLFTLLHLKQINRNKKIILHLPNSLLRRIPRRYTCARG